MPYEEGKYASWLVNNEGAVLSGVTITESCIQSAETIIQQVKNGGGRISRRDYMYAHFKGFTFNASTEDFMQKQEVKEGKLVSYGDAKGNWLPDYGEGIVLLNNTSKDLPYNMHFGAVVAWAADKVVISNMFEQVPNASQATLKVIEISSALDFAVQTFGKDVLKYYAIGLLSPNS